MIPGTEYILQNTYLLNIDVLYVEVFFGVKENSYEIAQHTIRENHKEIRSTLLPHQVLGVCQEDAYVSTGHLGLSFFKRPFLGPFS